MSTPDWKEEPEQIEGFACSQCGFDLRLPPECTKENWDKLNAELERERMRLAACSTAALGRFDGCIDDYKSASLDDVLKLHENWERLNQQLAEHSADKVSKYMAEATALEKENAKLKQQLAELEKQRDERTKDYEKTTEMFQRNEQIKFDALKQLAERDAEIEKLKEAVKWYKAAHELFAKHAGSEK